MYIRNNFGVMTENQQDKFVSLEAKVRVLIEKFEAEVEKNKELNAKISEVEMKLHDLTVEKDKLQSEYDSLKLVKFLNLNEEQAKAERDRLRLMVKKIDKCISLIK